MMKIQKIGCLGKASRQDQRGNNFDFNDFSFFHH